jgi:hypothetical protein
MAGRDKELTVAFWGELDSSARNLIKLANFMGVATKAVEVGGDSAWSLGELGRANECVVIRANVLRSLIAKKKQGLEHRKSWPRGGMATLVYGFEPTVEDSESVRLLTGAAFGSVKALNSEDKEYHVQPGSRGITHEFAGLTFGPTNPANDVVFERAKVDGEVTENIRIGNRCFLASVGSGSAMTMLAGAHQILDIDACVRPGARALEWFSQLIPAMLFLRHAFGERCWQAGRKLACFILDDPLLRPRYGFLQYDSLLEAMERSNFATSIAFVPWNYTRSRQGTTDLFLRHPKRFSLCIHGCDHTKEEFGGPNEVLSRKALIAKKRMERHRQLTGVPFDNVMVFPQGVFSSVAMKALKTAGYLGAVNSTPFSVDDSPEPLLVRDLMAPAIMRYSAFPLFVRHYPNRIAEFALDLFLGKPALIVEHHDYFRNGYDKVQTFAEQINCLSDGITWCGLEEVVRASCLKKQRDDGTFDVQFYDNRLSVVEAGTDAKESMARENLRVPAAFPSANGNSDLQLGSAPYRIGVSIRRYLCEFRDNYLSRSRVVVRGLNMLKSKLAK